MQSCKKMRIAYNDLDVVDMESASHTNGTYDVYENTADTDENWSKAPVSATSTGGYQYMSENIVSNPTVGNTTFVSIRVKTKPTNYTRYTPNSSLSTYQNNNLLPTTYYSIAFVDEATGYMDYTYNTASGTIIYFETKEMAQSYLDAANAGTVKVKLVSELDPTPSGAPAMQKVTRAVSGSLKLMTFTDGYVYYRINIEDVNGSEKKAMVKRNTLYTLNVKSIKKLGAPSESYLIPTDPSTTLDFSPESSSWLDTSFDIQEWTENNSDVNL